MVTGSEFFVGSGEDASTTEDAQHADFSDSLTEANGGNEGESRDALTHFKGSGEGAG